MNFEDYERKGLAAYTSLAGTVAAILAAAIEREGGYRLQQVAKRAKSPTSLHNKLQDRLLEGTTSLEMDIKDLAGCRLVFYTNSDVTRFINSGVIDQNFEVLEVKLHHPRRDAEEATDLYISNHYLVALRPARVALPEYASFAGMRCEVQVQTILNHAWAEMAHTPSTRHPNLASSAPNNSTASGNGCARSRASTFSPPAMSFNRLHKTSSGWWKAKRSLMEMR